MVNNDNTEKVLGNVIGTFLTDVIRRDVENKIDITSNKSCDFYGTTLMKILTEVINSGVPYENKVVIVPVVKSIKFKDNKPDIDTSVVVTPWSDIQSDENDIITDESSRLARDKKFEYHYTLTKIECMNRENNSK